MHIPGFPQRSRANLLLGLRQDSGWPWKRRRIAISILQMSIQATEKVRTAYSTAGKARKVGV